MIEAGNAYAVKYADVILNASLTSSKYTKASESVPFLGMVYHGSKIFAGSPTNMEGDINEAILHAIENGAAMYFMLSYQNTSELKEDFRLSKYYSVSYEIWKDDVAQYYTKLNDALKDLQTSYIVDHEFLDAERIPDDDEIEADALAAELAKQEEAEKAAVAAEKAERAQRLADRLAKEAAAAAGETEEPVEEPGEEVVEEPAPAGTDEPQEEAPEGFHYDEFGELVPDEVEEEEETLDKYKTVRGTVVRVEYEGGVSFILNYNSYEIKVNFGGQSYTVEPLSFVRID
jgi:hypothetical protein